MVPPALIRRLLFGAILLATVSACNSGTDNAAEVAGATVTATPPATTTPVPPTPEPPATATAEPAPTATPEPTPAPTLDPVARAQADLELIKEVHTRFMTELLGRDERDAESVVRFRQLIKELTAEDHLVFMERALADRQAEGEFVVGGGAISHIGDVDIYEDGLVEVFDCSMPTAALYDNAGNVTQPLDSFEWRSTQLRLQPDGIWRVVNFNSKIDEACDPIT